MLKEQINQVKDKMDKTVSVLGDDLDTIRTGRANPKMLDKVMVDYYGTMTPIKQMAQITVPEPRSLQIQPWDRSSIGLIDKAIQMANLGFNPTNDGTSLRINIPQLTSERRTELCKQAEKIGENAKVAIRNIRRDANDLNKKVRQAHVEIGAEITKAIIIAANPFAGTDEVKGEIDKLQAVIEKARGMADVTSTDKATIYVKKALDSAIWNTRFERDSKVLGKVPFKVYNELNKKITNAVGVQLSLRSTVADVEQAIKDLDEALKEAIAQAK